MVQNLAAICHIRLEGPGGALPSPRSLYNSYSETPNTETENIIPMIPLLNLSLVSCLKVKYPQLKFGFWPSYHN